MSKFTEIISKPFRFLFFRKGKTSRNFWIVLAILVLALFCAFYAYPKAWDKGVDWLNAKKSETSFLKGLPNIPQFFNVPFRLGLDLLGGTHLVYEADLSQVKSSDIDGAMNGVRDVIERRVNAFGISEPVVELDTVSNHHRLIVELAGVKDINQAINMIGETPFLEFKEERPVTQRNQIIEQALGTTTAAQIENSICINTDLLISYLRTYGNANDPCYQSTGLNGKFLTGAQVAYDQTSYMPMVTLQFNAQGGDMFATLTKNNIGKRVAIYLDGEPISMPNVQEAITGGKAQITGQFTQAEVNTLAERLNAGALPVPIKLVDQETIGPALGEKSLQASLLAGIIGLAAVILFMIFWYRLPGLVAAGALLIYTALMLAVFKLFSVTLTLAGIAGIILSIGMAVDANILIFARVKEELRWGKTLAGAIDEGFRRAWTSIRDSNVSSLITCLILFWLGTSVIKGFALTLAIGIALSMFSAIMITRVFLKSIMTPGMEKHLWMFGVKKAAPADSPEKRT